jgi:hypothetical protein
MEKFKDAVHYKIVQIVKSDDSASLRLRKGDTNTSEQSDGYVKFKNQLLEQFYHGLILEFETNMLKSTDKETNAEFIKTIPLLLEELHRLELYVKTLSVEGIKIDKTISKLVDLWLEIL